MQDVTIAETERFSDEQARIYRKWLSDKEIERVENASQNTDRVEVPLTQKLEEEGPVTLPVQVAVSITKTDKIARVNALIHSGIRTCIAFHNKYFVRIESIHPSPDGMLWYCPVYGDKNRTAITVPCNSPIILYVD